MDPINPRLVLVAVRPISRCILHFSGKVALKKGKKKKKKKHKRLQVDSSGISLSSSDIGPKTPQAMRPSRRTAPRRDAPRAEVSFASERFDPREPKPSPDAKLEVLVAPRPRSRRRGGSLCGAQATKMDRLFVGSR